MEKKHKHTSTKLLSQSYCGGIQKLSGNRDAIPHDFQIPLHTIKERKESWKKLLAKYSSKKSKLAVNIYTLQPVMELDSVEPVKRREPMRKSWSMVQYWVNTGNQPYMEDSTKTHSDTGSSLAEEEHLNSVKDLNTISPNTNPSPKKHLKINEIAGDKYFNSSSISSTVDTAAYILANNNRTKKADIIAIVEGSKNDNVEDFCVINSCQSINAIGNCSRDNQNLSIDQTEIVTEELTQEEINELNNSNTVAKNVNDVNLNQQIDNVIKTSTQKEANNFRSLFSDSDEQIIKGKHDDNFESRNSQIDESQDFQNNLSCSQTRCSSFLKPSKRKKLYNCTESLTEFTPVSEDNISHKQAVVKLQRCEHPALGTPHLIKRQKINFKRKKIQYPLSRHENKSDLFECTQNHSCSSSSNSSHIEKSESPCKKKSEITCINSCDKSYENCSDSKNVQSSLDKSSTKIEYNHFSNNTTNFLCKKFNLKPVFIVIYRLPHVYAESESKSNLNSVEAKTINNQNQKQKQISEEHIKILHKSYASGDKKPALISSPVSDTEDPFTSMIDDLFLNSTKNKQETLLQIESDQKIKKSELIMNKILSNSHTEYQNYLSNTKETLVINSESPKNEIRVKTINKKSILQQKNSKSKRYSKYVIVLSSSDESESSVTSKHVENKLKLSNKIKRNSVNGKPNEQRYPKRNHIVHRPIISSSSDENLSLPNTEKTKCNFKNNNRASHIHHSNSTSSKENNLEPSVTKDRQSNGILYNSEKSNDQENNSNKSSSIPLNKNGRVEGSLDSSFEDLTTFMIKCNNIKHIEDQINLIKSKLNEAMGHDNFQQAENKKLNSNLDNGIDKQKMKSSLSKRLSENSDHKNLKRPLKDKSHRKQIIQNESSSIKSKRKGSEILTSDDECIIPFKKKSVKSVENTNNKYMNLNFEELMLQDTES